MKLSNRATPCLSGVREVSSWIRFAGAVAILGVSTSSGANGIALNEQSASSAGTAYAGRSSSALDASTIFGNPAGLTKLKRTEISGGAAVISVSDDISNAQSSAPGTNKGDSVPLGVVPFVYMSTPLDDRFSIGLGLYAPSGLINDYENSFQGRYHGSYSTTKEVTLQPTIAYRINDYVSIGGGPTINRFTAKLKSDLATGSLNNGQDTEVTLKGDDTALGYNLGILFDLSEATSWGINYHSKVAYHLEGHTEVSGSPSVIPLDGNYNNKIDITMPESVDTSITHHFNNRWTGYLGTTWKRWSRIEKVETNNSGLSPLGEAAGLGRMTEEMNWRDTWSTAVGASYQWNQQWLLRAGYAYDPSPIRNADRSVRIPVGNRQAVTLGGAYSPNSDLTIDFAYGYLWDSKVSVKQSNNSGLQPEYSANYNNSANGVSVQATYRY
ncbi:MULTISPECIES: OmpP1/FadL family transporter [Pseudomonas]|uniref:OmpP1/FadL family transporter n=1 Tax=Pseudomonas TaxID=286 RepID=UPI00055D37D1|nr:MULTISPECIES: outer membrane protein transport protein [Pseudomonas]AZD16653.1 Long-chain fatty acid transport protein [Pseudomonas chlororaphis]ROL89877.1 Long-chain fatty acid transport protein [Pseudomonas chlororaphis]WDH33153.1 TonB-dependent receptor [Pseudomonas chlororaphis]WDH39237.1 TonB-dependent receptor [Pseudomonas chlororaphis]WDH45274.1 TonB-dependent receptor [Pseudomonas chlororaphis]